MTTTKPVEWHFKKFGELDPKTLYSILDLRNRVFVVEQDCVYLDTDGKDLEAYHFYGLADDTVVAYARILPPGLAFNEASIGRVVTAPSARRTGIGRQLMQKAIEKTLSQFTINKIRIGAQVYLRAFYTSLGFREDGEPYMEDGIPHVEMILSE